MRILFVENHAEFAKTVIDAFMGAHDVVVCPFVSEALALFAGGGFEAVLVDYDLDDGKGDELVRALRLKGARAPIIATSAHDRGNARLLDAGANAVLAKAAFQGVGALLQRVRPYPVPQSMRRPQPHQLAAALASAIPHVTPKQVAAIEADITDALFGEPKYWSCFTDGVVTHTELRNVILARADKSAELARQSPESCTTSVLARVEALETILFGRPSEADAQD